MSSVSRDWWMLSLISSISISPMVFCRSMLARLRTLSSLGSRMLFSLPTMSAMSLILARSCLRSFIAASRSSSGKKL